MTKITLKYLSILFIRFIGSGTRCFALQDNETIVTSLTQNLLKNLNKQNARTKTDSTDSDDDFINDNKNEKEKADWSGSR